MFDPARLVRMTDVGLVTSRLLNYEAKKQKALVKILENTSPYVRIVPFMNLDDCAHRFISIFLGICCLPSF
jgi:hypothetical protein